jgi:P27 family predicted phage terminase small subunit
MGKRGPAPKPAELKVIQGTFRKDRVAPDYLSPPVEAPECPAWLGAEAKEVWKDLVPELEALGVIARIDQLSLAALCAAVQRWREASRILEERGLTFETEKGFVGQAPEVAIERASWKEIRAWCHHFGLTPGARTRITAPPKDDGPKNPFEDL